MTIFRFHYPIVVRYGDLDPQWHVNHTRFLTFVEQARLAYMTELGFYDGKSFWNLPLIIGDVHCRYLVPIDDGVPGNTVDVTIAVTRIGNKSLIMESQITGENGTPVHAVIETTMIAYDYRTKKTVPVSDEMRTRLEAYEGRSFPKA